MDRLTENHPWGFALNRHFKGLTLKGTFAVNRLTQGVDHPTQHSVAHLDGSDKAGTLGGIAFLDAFGTAQEDRSNIILFEVQDHRTGSVRKFDQFPGLNTGQAVETGYTVPNLKNRTGFLELGLGLMACELFSENGGNFVRL
jgi:hypothetical protein